MKIGLVCPYDMYRGGGVQECVRALQTELEARGHHARIITPMPRVKSETKVIEDVIFVGSSRQIRSPFHTTSQISASVNNDLLEEVLDNEDFDVLHFHEPWVPILSRQILAKSRCANVATFHAKLPDTMMSKTIEKVITPYTKSILKDFDYLTAVSDSAAVYVKTLTHKPITLVSNGIDLELYKPESVADPKRLNILYIGRLEKRKGLKYLLDAYKIVKQNLAGAKLIIAGDGPDRKKLENYVKLYAIQDVEFLGLVSEKKKLELLSNARVFCSPAIYGESFGIVLLEAMAMGVPVVAGNNSGYTSVMKDRGRIGLVNPRDKVSFASTLEFMLEDEEVRKLWKTWAFEYVKQFDYPKVVDQYEALYKKALNKK